MIAGLSAVDAARLLRLNGRNEIVRSRATPTWLMLARQFGSPLIVLLGGACVIAAVLGETADALAIAAIVVINGIVGFVQEHRAERAIAALRGMTAPRARVRRDHATIVIPAAEVVAGDCLVLEAGDIVAADAHVVEAYALSVNESALTGESLPVEKSADPVAAGAPLSDRTDSVFMGTSIATGTGVAVVAATGMGTELGRIAHLLASTPSTATPLQQRLAALSRALLAICLSIVLVVALAGWLHGWPAFDVLLASVSLAVAAVPEGLPAVVTIALAAGVQRMASRHVLVRHLQAVETLGCATVICTDKTGTLTTGVMAVRELWGRNHERVLFTAAACCDAELSADGRGGTGDPTELAILRAAYERGIQRAALEERHPRVLVHPFDASRRRMAIARADGVMYVKGAVEAVLPLCVTEPDGASASHADMASRGLRVLAIAVGRGAEEADLELVGLIGIADPPRTEAIAAVAAARAAGITTVMITGDHPATARAIARELGIVCEGEPADERVHARATPERKLEVVRAWKQRHAIVAMTGDGVNDAPALREAHVGIAMGITGTEVTREASDMILTDDNFASIVAAVREGRAIFDNIRKTVVYLMSGNAAELAVMLVSAVLGLPLPLLPLHLLWINLVTDGLPALTLVMDPAADDVLDRPPRGAEEPMLGAHEWRTIAVIGLMEAITTLGVFLWGLAWRDVTTARTLAFSTLVFGELFRAFAARSQTLTFWEVGAFTNLRLLLVVSVSVIAQLAIMHIPATRAFFGMEALSSSDMMLAVVAGLGPVTAIELRKLVKRRVGHIVHVS